MIKYSVIGTSWITESFIDGAKLYDELLLDGVYSRSREKGEEFLNVLLLCFVKVCICNLKCCEATLHGEDASLVGQGFPETSLRDLGFPVVGVPRNEE